MPASSLSIDAHSHQPTISLPLADAVPLKEKWPALYNKSHFTSYRFLVDYAFILADEKTDYLLIGPYGNGQANGFVYQLDTPKVSKLSLPMGAAVCLSSATSTGFLIRTQWKEPSLFWPFITTSPLTNSTVHLDPRVDATQIFKLCLLWGNGTSQSPEIYRTFVLDHACIHSAKWLISVAFQTAHFAYLIHVNGTVYIFDSRVLTHAGIEMKSKLIVSSLETFFKCPVPLPGLSSLLFVTSFSWLIPFYFLYNK